MNGDLYRGGAGPFAGVFQGEAPLRVRSPSVDGVGNPGVGTGLAKEHIGLVHRQQTGGAHVLDPDRYVEERVGVGVGPDTRTVQLRRGVDHDHLGFDPLVHLVGDADHGVAASDDGWIGSVDGQNGGRHACYQ